MNLVPLEDRVIVEKFDVKKQTEGGILLPGALQTEEADRGKVIAIGSDVKFLLVNDVILFSAHAGIKYKYEGKEYVVLKENGISARVIREYEKTDQTKSE